MEQEKSNLRDKNFLYHFARCIVRPMFDVLSHLESHGSEHVPRQGGVLLVSNHVSLLDTLIIGAATDRELHFMGANTFYRIPGFGWLLTKFNGFSIKRGTPDRQALREALSRLQTGKALLVFPEGTRSVDGRLGEMKKGVSFMIHHSGVPVIPVFIKGAERFLPRGAKFIRPAKLSVTFGPPIDFTGIEGIAQKQELYQQMSEQIRQAISVLKEDSR